MAAKKFTAATTSSLSRPANEVALTGNRSEGKGKAIVGKSIPTKTSQKTPQIRQQKKDGGNTPDQFLNLLGEIDGLKFMAILQKLLNALDNSNGDLATSLLLYLPNLMGLLTKNQ